MLPSLGLVLSHRHGVDSRVLGGGHVCGKILDLLRRLRGVVLKLEEEIHGVGLLLSVGAAGFGVVPRRLRTHPAVGVVHVMTRSHLCHSLPALVVVGRQRGPVDLGPGVVAFVPKVPKASSRAPHRGPWTGCLAALHTGRGGGGGRNLLHRWAKVCRDIPRGSRLALWRAKGLATLLSLGHVAMSSSVVGPEGRGLLLSGLRVALHCVPVHGGVLGVVRRGGWGWHLGEGLQLLRHCQLRLSVWGDEQLRGGVGCEVGVVSRGKRGGVHVRSLLDVVRHTSGGGGVCGFTAFCGLWGGPRCRTRALRLLGNRGVGVGGHRGISWVHDCPPVGTHVLGLGLRRGIGVVGRRGLVWVVVAVRRR
eukprot:RCo002598